MTLLFLTNLLILQDDPPADLVDQTIQQLDDVVEVELARIRKLVPDARTQGVADAIRGAVKKAAEQYAREVPLGLTWPEVLDEDLSRAIADELGAHGQEYLKDVATRRRLFRDAVLDGTVLTVDYRVGLTDGQAKRVRRILHDKWKHVDRYWTPGAIRGLTVRQPRVLPLGFPEESVRKVLTEVQREAWDLQLECVKERQPILTVDDLFNGKLRALDWAPQTARLHALRLAEQIGATARQRQRLILAAKEAADSAADLQKAMVNAERAKAPLTLRNWEVSYAELPDLVACHTKWAQRARTVLDEDQRDVYDRLRKERAERARRALVQSLAVAFSRRFSFTAKEHAALLDMLMEAPTDNRGVCTSATCYQFIARIPEARWRQVASGQARDALLRWKEHLSFTLTAPEK